MRPPELCSKNRSGINSATRFTAVLLQFFFPHSWKQEHERCHSPASLTPHLQRPAAEGVTAHLCHPQFLRNIPMGQAPEEIQLSIWCPDHRNKTFTLLHITLAFHCTRGKKKKKKSYANWSKCQFQDAAFLKIPSYKPLLGTQRCFTNTQRPARAHYTSLEEELLQQRQNQRKTSTSGMRITPFILVSA